MSRPITHATPADPGRVRIHRASLSVAAPAGFSFRRTVLSHGWCSLPPFSLDRERLHLGRITGLPSGRIAAVRIEGFDRAADGRAPSRLRVTCSCPLTRGDRPALARQVRRMLRLDDDIAPFYARARSVAGYGWIARAGAGRLLRAPTVFEDLVKLLCTTNCSWSLTETMVRNLVAALGEPAEGAATPGSRIRTTASGAGVIWTDGASHGPAIGRAFPTPEAMAARNVRFYEKEVRAGYRARALAELSEAVASGRLDPELWLSPELSTAEIAKQILSVRGAGPYTAESLLKLLGRYDGLGLDSWSRAKFARISRAIVSRGARIPAASRLDRRSARAPVTGRGARGGSSKAPMRRRLDKGEKVTHRPKTAASRPPLVSDAAIARHYERFGPWRGLAFWCDVTRDWFEPDAPGGGAGDKF